MSAPRCLVVGQTSEGVNDSQTNQTDIITPNYTEYGNISDVCYSIPGAPLLSWLAWASTVEIIFLAILTTVAFGTNLAVLITVVRTRALRCQVTNYFVVYLCGVDLIASVAVLPISVASFARPDWEVSPLFCAVHRVLSLLVVYASCLGTGAISIERFYSIRAPLHHAAHLTNTRAFGVIIFVTIQAVILSIVPALMRGAESNDVAVSVETVAQQDHVTCYLGSLTSSISSSYVISVSILCYVIPCVILVAMYWNIYKVARKAARQVQPSGFPKVYHRRCIKQTKPGESASHSSSNPLLLSTPVTQLASPNFHAANCHKMKLDSHNEGNPDIVVPEKHPEIATKDPTVSVVSELEDLSQSTPCSSAAPTPCSSAALTPCSMLSPSTHRDTSNMAAARHSIFSYVRASYISIRTSPSEICDSGRGSYDSTGQTTDDSEILDSIYSSHQVPESSLINLESEQRKTNRKNLSPDQIVHNQSSEYRMSYLQNLDEVESMTSHQIKERKRSKASPKSAIMSSRRQANSDASSLDCRIPANRLVSQEQLVLKHLEAHWKAAATLLFILSAFVLLWSPYFILHVYWAAHSVSPTEMSPHAEFVVTWIAYASFATNAFIYGWMNRTIREELLLLRAELRQCFKVSRVSQDEDFGEGDIEGEDFFQFLERTSTSKNKKLQTQHDK